MDSDNLYALILYVFKRTVSNIFYIEIEVNFDLWRDHDHALTIFIGTIIFKPLNFNGFCDRLVLRFSYKFIVGDSFEYFKQKLKTSKKISNEGLYIRRFYIPFWAVIEIKADSLIIAYEYQNSSENWGL